MPYIGKSPQFGVRSRFYFTQSSAGGTSVSGSDDNSKTLKFSDGEFVDVMLNGITLVAGTDYNTTTANTIAGLSALANGDVVEVVVYDVFSVSDTVSSKNGGTFAGNVTFTGDVNGTPKGNSNLIINGAMQISQRGTSFSYAHDGTVAAYNLDRFNFAMRGGGYADEYDCTVAQVSDSPDGFPNSLKITTGTAESAIAADEYYVLYQSIEAQNLQSLGYGTSSAKKITLSFYVKSSLTGTFGTTLYQADDNRVINKTYTIDSANTWERKTITFPGDTTGVIDNDNGGGLNVYWTFGAGSDFDGGSATTWTAYTTTNLVNSSGSDALITTAGATWQVTGVQLELGEQATPFEHRSFGDELARCQRYYYKLTPGSGASAYGVCANNSATVTDGVIHYPVTMRDAPTAVETTGTATDYRVLATTSSGAANVTCSVVPSFVRASVNTSFVRFTVASGLTVGGSGVQQAVNADSFLAWSAEL